MAAHDWKHLVRTRLGSLDVDSRDPARAADIVDELAQHVAQHYADLVASGVDDREALERALAPMSDPARMAREIARADRPRHIAPVPPASSSFALAAIAADVRYAVRLLRRAPGFAAAAILTLSIGIGANTAIFSMLNAVLLRPLPYAEADRLVLVGPRDTDGSPGNVGYATFLDWRERAHGFDDMALIRSWSAALAIDGHAERVDGMRVSANFFRLLGVGPVLGRDFTAAEDTPAGWHVVMLSDALWRRRFGADPSAVGRTIRLNGIDFTIVGVMPASFEPLISEHFYRRAELWSLVGYDRTQAFACRTCQHLKAIGRLRAGTTIDAAAADIETVQAALRQAFPTQYASQSMAIVRLRDELTDGVRPVLTALMGAVGFVLLIACANVANLLLARMAAREGELALRAALGAGRGRLIRQLMIESAVLAAAAGALGIALAILALPILTNVVPAPMARLSDAGLDAQALAFSVAVSLATAVLFGLLPALRAVRINLQLSRHGSERRGGAPSSLPRRLLVAGNVAMAVVLLTGAGLMIRSVGRLARISPGFDPDRVLTLQVSMVGPAYAKDETVYALTLRMLERLRALPGVASAAAAGQIPLGGSGDRWGFHVQGRPVGPENPSVERFSVTPEYFAVMRIPLRRGRLLADADRAGAEKVIVIGEQTARLVWPNADPLGQHVRIGGSEGPWRTVVGIVGDVRHRELAVPPTMQMYVPQAQLTDSYLTFVLKTSLDPAALAPAARAAIWSVASDVPVYSVAPLRDLVARSVAPRRFVMWLLEMFAAAALLLTAVGVYGVISYSVAERTRELGIRAALGASRADLARLVVGGGLAVVLAGLAAGCGVAAVVSRYLESSLFGVSATDPLTFIAVVAALLGVTLAAHGVPVARAMRVDPAVALRQE